MNKKDILCAIAFRSLQGRLTEVPEGVHVADVLKEFEDLGGIKVENPEEVEAEALRFF